MNHHHQGDHKSASVPTVLCWLQLTTIFPTKVTSTAGLNARVFHTKALPHLSTVVTRRKKETTNHALSER